MYANLPQFTGLTGKVLNYGKQKSTASQGLESSFLSKPKSVESRFGDFRKIKPNQ